MLIRHIAKMGGSRAAAHPASRFGLSRIAYHVQANPRLPHPPFAENQTWNIIVARSPVLIGSFTSKGLPFLNPDSGGALIKAVTCFPDYFVIYLTTAVSAPLKLGFKVEGTLNNVFD